MAHAEHRSTYLPLQRRSMLRRMVGYLVDADARHRQAHALRNLPEHLRQDIGMLPEGDWTPPSIMKSHTLY